MCGNDTELAAMMEYLDALDEDVANAVDTSFADSIANYMVDQNVCQDTAFTVECDVTFAAIVSMCGNDSNVERLRVECKSTAFLVFSRQLRSYKKIFRTNIVDDARVAALATPAASHPRGACYARGRCSLCA